MISKRLPVASLGGIVTAGTLPQKAQTYLAWDFLPLKSRYRLRGNQSIKPDLAKTVKSLSRGQVTPAGQRLTHDNGYSGYTVT